MMDLSGKVAFVTGGGTGIGAAVAREGAAGALSSIHGISKNAAQNMLTRRSPLGRMASPAGLPPLDPHATIAS